MSTIEIKGIKYISGLSYDGQWQQALQPTPKLSIGDRIASSESCDDRQWDDLQAACPADAEISFDDHDDESGLDLYEVVAL